MVWNALRPAGVLMVFGGQAMDEVVEALRAHPVVLPDAPPEFPVDELKIPRTKYPAAPPRAKR